jgi:hypothetical protein
VEIEREGTRSHSVENLLWKGLWICCKTDCAINELVLAIQLVDYEMFLYICMAVVLYIFHSMAVPSVELNLQ